MRTVVVSIIAAAISLSEPGWCFRSLRRRLRLGSRRRPCVYKRSTGLDGTAAGRRQSSGLKHLPKLKANLVGQPRGSMSPRIVAFA
jgi:hypothetical protein